MKHPRSINALLVTVERFTNQAKGVSAAIEAEHGARCFVGEAIGHARADRALGALRDRPTDLPHWHGLHPNPSDEQNQKPGRVGDSHHTAAQPSQPLPQH